MVGHVSLHASLFLGVFGFLSDYLWRVKSGTPHFLPFCRLRSLCCSSTWRYPTCLFLPSLPMLLVSDPWNYCQGQHHEAFLLHFFLGILHFRGMFFFFFLQSGHLHFFLYMMLKLQKHYFENGTPKFQALPKEAIIFPMFSWCHCWVPVAWISCWIFCSVPVVQVCILTSKPYHFNNCSFIIYFEIKKCCISRSVLS